MSGSEDIISQEKPAFAKSAKEIKRLHWLTRFNDNFMRLFIKITPHFCLLRGSYVLKEPDQTNGLFYYGKVVLSSRYVCLN